MDPASGEEYDEHVNSEGEESLDETDELELKNEAAFSPPSAKNAGGLSSGKKSPAGNSSSLQKRRRVTRACDECRRKKIKCDGKQPCTHCTVYSSECTYDQPSNRRRNPVPQYVENLEHRVHRAEGLLHILIPNLDLNDPGIDLAVAQGWIPGAPGKGAPGVLGEQESQRTAQQQAAAGPFNTTATAASQQQQQQQQTTTNNSKMDTNIESMLRAVAQLDMDETGNWGYHGHSSGLSFVRRMREQLGDLMGPDTVSSPFVKSRPLSETLESPRSMAESPVAGSVSEHSPTGGDLPPKAIARETCTHAVDDAAALLQVVHRPTFWNSFERLYSVPSEQYTNEDQKFLPLFYAAMALGSLFRKDAVASDKGSETYENAIQQGITYFRTARSLTDIIDCRGITSIQAVLFMTLFLQSSAKLSQCYAYVGVALRSALRMGLHRSHGDQFGPLESETRKRIFWVVRKMDIYVCAMLGLPLVLSDDDIDQDFPAEVDDEYLTADGILPMPEGQVSLMTAFNVHTRLVQILSKIVHCIYPIKMSANADKSYSVPFSAIRGIESDLEAWKQSLPAILNPCPAPERFTRVQQLLRLTYAHAQVMLYRPFLHFVAMHKRSQPMDQRSYAFAASYVNVSRNIVHIQTQMQQKGLLNGAFWFTQYTAFFAILSLVYFAAENPDNTATEGIMKDAIEGKDVLASLARRSMAADRCTATLDVVFARLPDWMRNGQQNPIISRKRHLDPKYAASRQAQQQVAGGASRGHTDVSSTTSSSTRLSGDPMQGLAHQQQQRASTFPMPASAAAAQQQLNVSTDAWSQSGSTPTIGPQTPTTGDFVSAMSAAAGATGAAYLPYSQQPPPPGFSGLQHNQPYLLPPDNINYANPALADIQVMFPDADEPFGYPNQPLTTFENQHMFLAHQAAKNSDNNNNTSGSSPADGGSSGYMAPSSQAFGNSSTQLEANATSPLRASSSGNAGAAPGSRGGGSGREDGLEAQLSALPPYLDRAQIAAAAAAANSATAAAGMSNPFYAAAAGRSMGNASPVGMPEVWGPPGLPSQHAQQQQQARGHHHHHHQQQQQQHLGGMHAGGVFGGMGAGNHQINIQQIFGGDEWNPMLTTGYQTQ